MNLPGETTPMTQAAQTAGATTTAATAPKKKSRAGLIALLLVLGLPMALCAPLCLSATDKGSVAEQTILELDLEQPLSEAGGGGDLWSSSSTLTTRDLVFALERGAKDDKVKGLFARIGGAGHGIATAQEVRDAVIAFRASGKPAYAYSESFGELSPGTGGYYVASAFDQILLMPTGNVSLTALSGEGVFAKGAFDKVGIEAQFSARKEYKNAPNTFTEQTFTGPHKEATLRLLSEVQRQIASGIAEARPALGDAAAVAALLGDGPYSDQQALAKKLVDQLAYKDEALALMRAKAGKDAKLLWLSKYLERAGSPYDDKAGADATTVAVVTGVGQILRGTSNVDPLGGAATIGSDTLSQALREAVADKDVKAILLRVDSPGGSVTASEAIAHEVQRAVQAKKPVVVSMANVAGSGGYYIAMNADAIVAQPGTITGSIGVYAGKFVTTKLFDQLGVNFDTVVVDDKDVSFFSTDQPYSEDAKRKLDALVDGIYRDFVTKVAAGRKRSFEQMEPVAHGRIWAGSDGKDNGLVDALGGYPVALGLVREKLSLPKDAPLRLKDFPRRQKPFERLLAAFDNEDGESSEQPSSASLSTSRPTLASAQALVRAALAQEPAVLLTPSLQVLP